MFSPKELAEAVCVWLEAKRLFGLQSLFGEALLSLGVAEYLLSKGFYVEAEQDLRTVLNNDKIPAGYLNFDLTARECKGGKISSLFELKFLKAPRGKTGVTSTLASRITDDIYRLAYPEMQNVERYFVVARECDVKLPSKIEKIFEDKSVEFSGNGFAPSSGLKETIGKVKQTDVENEVRLSCQMIISDASYRKVSVSVCRIDRVD